MAKKQTAQRTTRTARSVSKTAKATSSRAAKSSAVGKAGRKKAARRELIDTGSDKRYVRRNEQGQFHESVDVGRSLSQDRRRRSTTASKPGQGDRGDR